MSLSRGGWSGAPLETDEVFSTPDDDRYAWRDFLGMGGMGSVHAVFDARLGREVAMKILASDAGSEAHLRAEREARITARLEHPAIVPVHDAGETPDGRSFFTMRIVRGRSLADRLAEEPGDTLELLRAFLVACEAVAYAHSRGVVHRDLKPDNLMIGAFGEVQIVDWGLAAVLGEADPFRGSRTLVGTLGYASPEQMRGEPADPRADVYGLGAILRDILDAQETVPEDLQAIREKACARAARDRYDDARALATDVAAFIDGRRVAARTYSSWELASRFFRVYRRWIAGTLLTLIAVGVGVGVAFGRVRKAQLTAEAARRESRDALEERSAALATAREEQAVAALADGAVAEAELLALAALEQSPSPLARGVLMRTHGGARWAAERAPIRCEGQLHLGRDAHGCITGGRLSFEGRGGARWRGDSGPVAEVRIGATRIALRGPDGMQILDRSTGEQLAELSPRYRPSSLVISPSGERLGAIAGPAILLHREGDTFERFAPCTPGPATGLALGDRHVVATCSNGNVAVVDPEGELRMLPLPEGVHPFSLALAPGDRRLAIGTLRGVVLLMDLDGTITARWPVDEHPIGRVGWLANGGLLVVSDSGSARVVDEHTGLETLRLPRHLDVSVDRGTLIATDGAARWTWRSGGGPVATLRAPAGLSSAAFGPGWVVLARGDGSLSIHAPDGRLFWEPQLTTQVVKWVAADRDGALVAAVADEPGLFALDVSREAQLPLVGTAAHRRVVALDDGFLAASYDDFLSRWGSGAVEAIASRQTIDLDVSADRSRVALLHRDGSVEVWDGAPEQHGTLPFAVAVAVGPEGLLAVAGPDRVHLSARGEERAWSSPGPILDLAIAPDGRTIAAGTRPGDLLVWDRNGTLLAHARDATDRVCWVGFAPDGRLATASWDGALRFYEPAAIDRSVAELQREAQRAWAFDLSE